MVKQKLLTVIHVYYEKNHEKNVLSSNKLNMNIKYRLTRKEQ